MGVGVAAQSSFSGSARFKGVMGFNLGTKPSALVSNSNGSE
jgi:hypothetical protein